MHEDEELARLEEEERRVSAKRRRLHDRIDFARQAAIAGGAVVDLDALLAEEQEVSTERKALHARIDALRVQLGLPPGPPPRESRLDRY